MNTPKNLTFIVGDEKLLPSLEDMWNRNSEHHQSVSRNFSDRKPRADFHKRCSTLQESANNGMLRVDIAMLDGRAGYQGYCISTVSPDGLGEIQSLFVEGECRGLGVGSRLLDRAVAWMDKAGATLKRTYVVVGNDQALPLYAKQGFLPSVMILEQKTAAE